VRHARVRGENARAGSDADTVAFVAEPATRLRSDARVTVVICLTIATVVPLLGILFGVPAIWQSVRLLRLPGYSRSQRRTAVITLPVASGLTMLWLVYLVLVGWMNSG